MKKMKCEKKGIWIDQRKTEWFSTDELLEYLGITKSELDQQSRLFIEGVHYKKKTLKETKLVLSGD